MLLGFSLFCFVTICQDTATWHRDGRIKTLDVRDGSLIEVLRFLADRGHFQLVIDSSVKDCKITFVFHDLTPIQAIEAILHCEDLAWQMVQGMGSVKRHQGDGT